MGFTSWIKKSFKTGIKQTYNRISNGVKTGFHAVHQVFKYAGQGAHYIDNLLSQSTGIPIVDDILSLVKDNPLYAEVLGGLDAVNTTLDDLGQLGTDADSLIRAGTGWGQQEMHASNPSNTTTNFHNFGSPTGNAAAATSSAASSATF